MPTSHLVRASSCSSSASVGRVSSNQRQVFAGQAALRQHIAGPGCSSASVAVGGTNEGTRCFAEDNGQAQLGQNAAGMVSRQSCSASNQNQLLAAK